MKFIYAVIIILFNIRKTTATIASFFDTSKPCNCSWSYKIHYPESAINKNLSGEVIISIKVDSAHYLFDPEVSKSLDTECDKEALRVCNLIIMQLNNCEKKCGYNNNLEPGAIIKQTFTFEPPGD